MIKSMCCLLALIAVPVAQAAGVYRWVDEDGKLHYEDRAVVNSKRVTRESLSKRDIPANPELPPPPAFVLEVSLTCANYQDRLHSYREAGNVYARDPSGNRVQLSDRQQKLLVAQTEQDVQRYCNPNAARQLYAQQSRQ